MYVYIEREGLTPSLCTGANGANDEPATEPPPPPASTAATTATLLVRFAALSGRFGWRSASVAVATLAFLLTKYQISLATAASVLGASKPSN